MLTKTVVLCAVDCDAKHATKWVQMYCVSISVVGLLPLVRRGGCYAAKLGGTDAGNLHVMVPRMEQSRPRLTVLAAHVATVCACALWLAAGMADGG